MTEMCILIERHGCSLVYPFHELASATDGSYRLQSSTWRRMPFVQSCLDTEGRRVLRSVEPAIGPGDRPWCPLYTPAGWEPPLR
jgi:hypothetical protein